MKAVKVAISAVALASGSAVMAEDLVYYAKGSTGSLKYYDRDTIRRVNGGYITVWTFEDGSKDRTVKFRTRRILMKIDCESMSSGAMHAVDYDANGQVIGSGNFEYPRITPDVPGSTGYLLVEAVCAS